VGELDAEARFFHAQNASWGNGTDTRMPAMEAFIMVPPVGVPSEARRKARVKRVHTGAAVGKATGQ